MANGLPRPVEHAVAAWVATWRRAVPGFAPESLEGGRSSPLKFDYLSAGLSRGAAKDIGDRALDVYSPDSSRFLNFDRLTEVGWDEDGTLALDRDADSAPILGDVKSDTLWQVDFCGTSCSFDGAYWVDAGRFALTGLTNSEQDSLCRAFLDVYDLQTRQVRRWLGQPVNQPTLTRYQAASDSALGARLKRSKR
ncbi:MAG: hypothetical protein ACHQ52_03980 [Candidatus Eisenbacteria bacterium]